MATIAQIRDALKTRLTAGISGLEVYDTVPGKINAPAAVIRRRSGPRPATHGSSAYDYTFEVVVFTSLSDDTLGQDKLDAYLAPSGASSVIAALEADPDLGSTVEFACVSDAEQEQIIEYGSQQYLAVAILVDVGAA